MAAALIAGCAAHAAGPDGWRHYGASLMGDRYASPSVITPDTVEHLAQAWIHRTGDATRDGDRFRSRFNATPILAGGKLFFSTGFNRVFALDPATGAELWSFDPEVDFSRRYSEMYTSRGVAFWDGLPSDGTPCRERVFLGTLDARLIALDAATGTPCADFGEEGTVDLSTGIRPYYKTDYSVTSPPTIVGDRIVVGAAVGDNGSVNPGPGVVRAFDVHDGSLAWSWDPLPTESTGGANTWTAMAADAERDLVFLPTTSPAPDFYGGKRLGDNAFANSVVALRASTGEFVWGYQTIRHDLWDYDLAAQPLLFEHTSADGTRTPALAQASKTGFVFVLNRETGEPLHPVEERAVPKSDVPGEQAARTQPFPKLRLHDTDARPLEFWNHSPEHSAVCERLTAGVRYEGAFTPPSLTGTLLYPGNVGGTNWGSMAYDRGARIGYLIVNRWPTIVKLFPRDEFRAAARKGTLHGASAEYTAQDGTPYGMARFDLVHNDLPCLEGPWSTLAAVDLNRGEVLWERPAGRKPGIGDEAEQWSHIAVGGPMVTEGGVVFHATTSDHRFRAYDGADGSELWSVVLPAGAHSTPMGYRHDGADYVVITAGEGLTQGRGRGDFVVAFRLTPKTP